MPRRVSTFKFYSTNYIKPGKDKSPFCQFIEEELEPLPELNIKIYKPYESDELIIYRTPDRLTNYAYLNISDRIDFDMLTSPLAKRKNLNEYNEMPYGSSEGIDGQEESIEEDQESSYVTPQKIQVELDIKTPIKEPISMHQTRQKSYRQSQDTEAKQAICCNCKKSRCLKLYCDCFRSNQVCHGCNCVSCLNTTEHHEERYSAMLAILEINQEAFKPKILVEKHAKGCNCKKSGCLKKYCECYQAGLKCSELCKCEDCKNAKTKEHREPSKHRQRATVKKQARYDSYTKKLIT